TALALILSAASSAPAFAVNRNQDGTVTLWIREARGIDGANAKLAALGVRARAVQVTAGCQTPAGAPAALRAALRRAQRPLVHTSWAHVQVFARARINPREIPAGHTLVLPALRVGREVRLAQWQSVHGGAPHCFPFPAAAKVTGPPAAVQGVICRLGGAV